MGFNSVYRCLQEVFPQIDARILKAVAIEHSKDADAAVNDILTDVLPYLSAERSTVRINSPRSTGSRVEIEENVSLLRSHPVVELADAGSSSSVSENNDDNACTNGNSHADIKHLDEVDDAIAGPSSESKSAAVLTDLDELEDDMPTSKRRSPCPDNAENCVWTNGDLTHVDEAVNESKVSSSCIANDSDNQLGMDSIIEEELILLGKTRETKNELELGQNAHVVSNDSKLKGTDDKVCMDTENEVRISYDNIISQVSSEQTSSDVSTTLVHEKGGFNGSLNGPDSEWKAYLDHSMANDFDLVTDGRICKVDACVDDTLLDSENFMAELAPQSVKVQTADSTDPSVTSHEGSQASGSSSLTSKKDCSISEMDSIEDDIARNSIVSRTNEICRIDILDEIIEDAKNNKKTLFSAMESVINMMKEVEIQERAAEHAKEEAALGGLDTLIKVEELKQMLAHAKEANSMHAGEVYGEKAILATEVRELQSRLLCLSDERDKSLATLDEIHQTLEARLAAAEDLRKAAEHEKLDKEESARNLLAQQEEIMENVVQESRLIAQAAEENSKLREFLVDRGRILDTLQGEISVICQDVSLLKDKFDKRLPLSMSVSSSQTSCKLASSGSSLKSVTSVLVLDEEETSKKPENRSPSSSIGDVTPKSRAEEDSMKPDQKELWEDGWDIVKDDELAVKHGF